MILDLYNGFTPRKTQRKFLDDRHMFCCVAGGRGSMKTTAACWRTMELATTIPYNTGIIGRWKKVDLYATTIRSWLDAYPRDKYGDIWRFFGGDANPDGIQVKNMRSGSYDNGSTIFLAPLQMMDKYRGGNFGFFFVDQMEECHPSVWGDLVKVLRKSEVPKSLRFGYATVNKKKEYYWIRRLFKDKIPLKIDGMKAPDMSQYMMLEPDWDENVEFVRDGYYENIKASARSEAEIQFEVYGKDPSAFGAVFPELSDSVHTREFEFHELGSDVAYYLAYDEGFDVPSAFLFCAVTPDGTHWFRAEHYRARTGIAAHKDALRRIADRIHFPLTRQCNYIADRAIFGKMDGNGISIADQWGNDWPWRGASKDRISGWERMRALQERQPNGKPRFYVHAADCPEFMNEMREAMYDPDKAGRGAWEGRCDDHACDAARMLCAASQEPTVFTPVLKVPGSFRDFREAQRKGLGWEAPGLSLRAPLLLPRKPL